MQENSSHISASQSSANQIEVAAGSSTSDISNVHIDNAQNNDNPPFSRKSSIRTSLKLRRKPEISQNPIDPQSRDVPNQVKKGLAGVRTAMLIMTDDKGYNSGRKYYFQANSDFQRREIVDILGARSKAARISKEAKGKLERIRERVGDIIKSDPFQYFFAFLIAMVRL